MTNRSEVRSPVAFTEEMALHPPYPPWKGGLGQGLRRNGSPSPDIAELRVGDEVDILAALKERRFSRPHGL
ncbi:hypothetical protein, partial [Baaleninema sp.]|uniref:hypothetical protein n=1 Tax=Baaleninema sp. TaxID=3101197 RepID=UPI003CFD4A8C